MPLPVTVWQKRHQAAAAQAAAAAPDELRDFQHHLDAAVNSQMMLRSPRGERQYDVPQIGKSAHGNVTWLLNPEARYKAIRCLIFPGHLIVYCRNYNAKMILLWRQKSIVIPLVPDQLISRLFNEINLNKHGVGIEGNSFTGRLKINPFSNLALKTNFNIHSLNCTRSFIKIQFVTPISFNGLIVDK